MSRLTGKKGCVQTVGGSPTFQRHINHFLLRVGQEAVRLGGDSLGVESIAEAWYVLATVAHQLLQVDSLNVAEHVGVAEPSQAAESVLQLVRVLDLLFRRLRLATLGRAPHCLQLVAILQYSERLAALLL